MGVLTAAEPAPAVEARPATSLAGAWAGLAACLAIGLLLVARRHEPWFDEAQAWLLARDSSLVELLAERVRYEGSPGLWHALLWAASRIGLPYEGLWLVSCGLALAGAALVLRASPFPPAIALGVALSYWFAYQYAVVARSYALDLVLLPALAMAFAGRVARPVRYGLLVGLLANVNAHSFVMAAILGVELAWACRAPAWRRERGALLGLTLAVALGLAAVAQAWPPPDGTFAPALASVIDLARIPALIGQAFIERADLVGSQPPSPAALTGGAFLSLLALAPSWVLFRRAGRLPLFAGLTGGLLAFSVATYANAWHAGFLYLAWLFCLWTSWGEMARAPMALRRAVLAGVAAVLATGALSTVAAWSREWRADYSSGEAVAGWLKAQPPGAVAGMGFKLLAAQPHLARNGFANLSGGAAAPSFLSWRRGEGFPVAPDLAAWTKLAASGRHDALVLSPDGLDATATAAFAEAARVHGYCAMARFAGALIWKGHLRERDDAIAFTRCGRE